MFTSSGFFRTAAFTFAALVCCRPAWAVVADAPSSATPADIDQLIVRYRRDPSDAQLKLRMGTAQRAGASRGIGLAHKRRGALGIHVLKLSKMLSVAEARAFAKELAAQDPNIEYAEPDLRMWPAMVPNDAFYSLQWHYSEPTGGINLPLAWDRATGNGVRVAVIDTGSRPHEDLNGAYVGGYDFISNAADARDGNGRDADPQDQGDWRGTNECASFPTPRNSTWHGTHVAGTIAARTNNSLGVAGVAYNARIVPVRVLGRCGGTVSDIADAIVWASGGAVSGVPANANPARVLNVSISALSPAACGATYQNAINSARSRNAIVIVAAGNSGTTQNHPPGNCGGIMTVGATNRAGGRAPYSNYGARVSISAPGGEVSTPGYGVLSTLNNGTTTPLLDGYVFFEGTSMATPHVSGVAALMLELDPTLTSDQMFEYLYGYARPFPVSCFVCGAGILNARATLDAVSPLVAPGAPPAPQWVTFAGCDAAWIASGYCSPYFSDWLPTSIGMDFSSPGATSYEAQVAQTYPNTGAWLNFQVGSSTSALWTMAPDTYWAFRVRACNAAGCGAFGPYMDAGTSTP